MNSLVLDTHSIIWFLANSSRLSATARQVVNDAIDANTPVFVSAITIVEIIYLVEKGRIAGHLLPDFVDTLSDPDSGIQIVNLDVGVAMELNSVSRNEVPDMPDRIIAATAMHLGLSLVTADAKLQASSVPTLW